MYRYYSLEFAIMFREKKKQKHLTLIRKFVKSFENTRTILGT